jgi:hypothetical protein
MTIRGKGNRALGNIKPAQTTSQIIPNKSIQEKQIEHASTVEKSIQSDKKVASTKEKTTPPKEDPVKKVEIKTVTSKSDTLSQNKAQTNKKTETISTVNLEISSKNNSQLDQKKSGKPLNSNTNVSIIRFKIQLAALPQKSDLTKIAKEFEIPEKEITEEKHNGLFKYTYGEFPTLEEARKKMNSNNHMKSKSFVAGYRNGMRIDLEEAIRLNKTK